MVCAETICSSTKSAASPQPLQVSLQLEAPAVKAARRRNDSLVSPASSIHAVSGLSHMPSMPRNVNKVHPNVACMRPRTRLCWARGKREDKCRPPAAHISARASRGLLHPPYQQKQFNSSRHRKPRSLGPTRLWVEPNQRQAQPAQTCLLPINALARVRLYTKADPTFVLRIELMIRRAVI